MSRFHNVHGKFRFLLTGIYIVCLTLFTITAFADTYQHTISPTHAWQWQNKQANADGFSTSLQIEAWHIQEGDQGQQIRVRGQLPTDDSFPMISTLLAAPAGMRVEATLQPTGQSASTGISTGELDELPQLVEVGNAFQFRGIQLYPIRIHPIEIENGEYQVITNAQLNVHYIHDNDSPANDEPVRVTVESRRYLEAHVLNLDEIDLLEVAPVGRILVVTNDADLRWDQIKDYVTWKTQQGYKVDVAEPVNDSEWGVRSIIEEYYFNGDEIPLEYVLLIGDDNGAIRVSAYNDLSDHYYTEMEGNDYHADLAIGRFSVRSTSELRRVVNKTLAYERDVYMDDTEWLESACLTAGAGSGISPIQTKRSVKWMLNRNNISSDTLWFNMNGDITDFIIQSVNAGASYVNYRGLNGMDGWNSNDNGRFNNASRLPIVVTLTCGTGSFATENECISEGIFRAGTGTTNFKGGVVCIGTATLSTHTRFNNVVDAGIFEGMMLQDLRSVGWSLMHGKARLYEAYNNTGDEGWIQSFTYWNNLMGDPALRVWKGVPDNPQVNHNPIILAGQNYLDVDVTTPNGMPEFAWATLTAEVGPDEWIIIDTRRLDANGHTRLEIEDPEEYDEVLLTVTGDNLVPYQDEISRVAAEIFVGIDVVDGLGNDDVAKPGELLNLSLILRNSGDQASEEYAAEILITDERLNIEDGGAFLVPPIQPGESTTIDNAVTIRVASWAQDGSTPSFTLVVHGIEDYSSSGVIPVESWTATSPSLPEIDDEDDRLLPNDEGNLVFTVRNDGSIAATNMSGTLYCSHPEITILDNTCTFGNIAVNQTRNNNNNPFQIEASSNVSMGEKIEFVVELESDGAIVDSVSGHIYIGDPSTLGLVGPDKHGYWALDDEDEADLFPLRPEFDWIDISDIGDNLNIFDTGNEDDESVVVDLPFPFTYYGEEYTQATICSNGWLAFGNNPAFITFRNWPIPNPLGPPAMLAVFWDDLITSGGGVYSYYDAEQSIFVVQWNTRTLMGQRTERFELVLYDQASYPTSSGNGRILYQYDDVNFWFSDQTDNDYGTVGIESPDQQDGVQYVYWELYSDGAEDVTDGRAILFTDDLSLYTGTPIGSATPESFEFALVPGNSITDSLQISNTGDGPLVWQIELINNEITTAQRNQAVRERAQRMTSATDTAEQHFLQNERTAKNEMDDLNREEHTKDQLVEAEPQGPPVITSLGGPDAYGYEWVDSNEPDGPTFQWHEDYGTEITELGEDPDDGNSEPLNLPFAFDFYGNNYNTITICTNGYITFVDGQLAGWRNELLPEIQAPISMIAAWWDDLDITRGGAIYFWTNEEDSVVVTFEEIRGWNQPQEPARGGPYTFQVVLTSRNSITLNYLEMVHEDDTRLDESTIGIQNDDATIGLTVLYNNENYIEDNLAILLRVPNYWFDLTSYTGVVGVDQTRAVEMQISSISLPLGLFEGSMLLTSNAPNMEELILPVSLEIFEGGEMPDVADIPGQTVEEGEPLDYIILDNFVEDPHYSDRQIEWSVEGNEFLDVVIVNRIAQISAVDEQWNGTETIAFIATNPEGLADQDDATFIVTGVDNPPTPFDLLQPGNSDTLIHSIVLFNWEDAVDPEGEAVHYTLHFSEQGDTVQYVGLEENFKVVALDTLDLNLSNFSAVDWWVSAVDVADNERESDRHFTFYPYWLTIPEAGGLPFEYAISEPYPNPFNPEVTVEIALPISSPVTLQILDLLGREIEKREYGSLSAGYHSLSWQSRTTPSGVYFLRIQAGPEQKLAKIVMLK